MWHSRLENLSTKALQILVAKNSSIVVDNKAPYDYCHFAKQKHLNFPTSTSCDVQCFDFLHVDVWGPFSIVNHENHRYFLIAMDDFSRCTWVFLLVNNLRHV